SHTLLSGSSGNDERRGGPMRTERMSNGEPLFELVIEEMSAAPPDTVYDLLEDLRQHAVWGGTQQKKSYRLASIDAPPGPASVGIESRSVGIDPGGAFADTSVVTEATRPTVFEFVTEARQQPKRGGVIEWTNVNRYELASRQGGTSI